MKILFVNNGLAGGGAEKLINDLLPIINKNHECNLLILSDKDEKYLSNLVHNKVKVFVIPKSCNNHIKRINYIKKIILNGHYDIVHANTFPTIYYCGLIRKIWKPRSTIFVMTEHNTDNRRRHHKLLRPIEKYIYSAYSRVVSISKATQDALVKWLRPKSPNRFCVIENGVPIEDFFEVLPLKRKSIIKNYDEETILLCMVGSFTEQKNHKLMIKIMGLLPSKYHLLLLGEGVLLREIEMIVKQMKLNDRVHFMGFRKDVPQIMKTCDIVVIPSKWEGFGLVAVEAMACGKPVVCSSVPGLEDVVGSAGITVDLNAKDFSRAIVSLEDRYKYDNFCEMSKKRSQDYSITTMSNLYVSLYNQLINKRRYSFKKMRNKL